MTLRKVIRRSRPEDEEETKRLRAEHLTSLYLIDGEQLAEYAQQEVRFLITEAIPECSVNFVYGLPETAKSWVAYSMVLSMLTGHKWLDFEVPKPTLVRTGKPTANKRTALVFNFDNPIQTLGQRWAKLGLRSRELQRRIRFHSIGMPSQGSKAPTILKLPNHYQEIMELLDYHRPDAVLIDGFRSSFIGSENNEQAAEVMSMIRSFTAHASSFHTGAAVIVLHHPVKTQKDDPKIEGEEMRGSGEVFAGIDTAIKVTKIYENKGLVRSTVKLVKKRSWDGEKWNKSVEVIDLGEKNTAVRLFDVGEAMKWLLMQKGPMIRKQIGDALGLKGVELARSVDRALELGQLEETVVKGRKLLQATKNRRNPEDSGD